MRGIESVLLCLYRMFLLGSCWYLVATLCSPKQGQICYARGPHVMFGGALNRHGRPEHASPRLRCRPSSSH